MSNEVGNSKRSPFGVGRVAEMARFITLHAKPAELVPTAHAGHVIAATVFLNGRCRNTNIKGRSLSGRDPVDLPFELADKIASSSPSETIPSEQTKSS